nr:hypothetical protein [Tanacetum cinerariifolium]
MIHMPKGAKVLKDILSHKDKLEKMASSFKLSEEYTAIIQRSLPQKEGDPGSFTLPCPIGPLAEQWVDIVNHYGKWTKEKEEEDSNEALAVSFNPRTEPVEPLEWKAPENRLKPSSSEPPKLKLKELPEHLELLEVFWNHKGAIAWSIADIKGIDSSFCTHKLLMKDDFKPSFQTQRRVNPNIKEVVKKEVIKLLDARLIYPISDSPCVSSVQVVLKKVSGSGIEVDKAKIKAISKLPYPMKVKAIRSFIGHAGFYRRFIKDFSQIARQMTHLLVKDSLFNSSKECIQAFNTLKPELTHEPIIIKPDWSLPFEIMCDASNYAVGVVLGKRTGKHFKPIHYASKTTNEAQENYTTTEKELLAVLPFRSTRQEKQKFFSDLRHYFWDEPFLFKQCADRIIRRYVAGDEAAQILRQCHSGPSGGHHGITTTARKETSHQGMKHLRNTSKNNPFRIIYGKACHLPAELEHKAYWAIKNCNLDLVKAGENRFLQINDKRIKAPPNYEKGDMVLLFNLRLRLFSGKLKLRWYEPFYLCKDMKNGVIELYNEDGN